jgi:two-component system OmpR family sensor kinase
MTLRSRLVLAFGLLALLTAALYGGITYMAFQRQQWTQLENLLSRELTRMEGAFADPRVGVPLFDSERGGTVVQLVTSGRVVLPRPAGGALAVLPAVEEPGVVSYRRGYYLSALRPLSGGSSLRVGLDVTDEILARRSLARQLTWIGLGMALLSVLTAAFMARRVLAPLTALARRARAVDPADPEPVEYRGPHDEVENLASALNAALSNIRLRRQEERAFLAEVAHELAAPLTLVKGHLDAFERHRGTPATVAAGDTPRSVAAGDTPGAVAAGSPAAGGHLASSRGQANPLELPGTEHLRAAQEAAQELLLTSQDLLAVARGELDRPVHNEVLRLDELLSRLARAYPGVNLLAQSPGRVVGDAHQLLQAIRNLVRNAVQASGGAEGVSIELAENGELVELRVRDSGPGIPPERLDRIFERFFSGSSGAGVGLTVVSRIVEQHGGELRVETGSEGSCFTVALPSFAAQLATSP